MNTKKPTQPTNSPRQSDLNKGYQPQRAVPTSKPGVQGGYTPLTGEGAPSNPTNEGTSRKK